MWLFYMTTDFFWRFLESRNYKIQIERQWEAIGDNGRQHKTTGLVSDLSSLETAHQPNALVLLVWMCRHTEERLLNCDCHKKDTHSADMRALPKLPYDTSISTLLRSFSCAARSSITTVPPQGNSHGVEATLHIAQREKTQPRPCGLCAYRSDRRQKRLRSVNSDRLIQSPRTHSLVVELKFHRFAEKKSRACLNNNMEE